MTQPAVQPALLKQLASNDKKSRDAALQSIRTYLTHRKEIDELELFKLWKGLFYCMWMSDKPRNQQQLARDLAGLVDVLPEEVVLPFLDTFWKTMAREWGGIDVLRMDKFLYLVRQYLNASFKNLARSGWKDTAKLDEYMAILALTPLNPKEQRIPNGLRYHMIDIYLDGLQSVEDTGHEDSTIPWEKLLTPFRTLGQESPTKSIRERVMSALEDERVKGWLGESSQGRVVTDKKPLDDDGWCGIED